MMLERVLVLSVIRFLALKLPSLPLSELELALALEWG